MKTIDGDILAIDRGIIVHQVNCQHVMGAGLALQIRKKYPRHYSDFASRVPHLGGLVITQVSSELYIVGVYGQYNIGREKRQTDYNALRKGLSAVQKMCAEMNLPVYLPYGIGCGLAGGSWAVVEQIIASAIPNSTIVRKKG